MIRLALGIPIVIRQVLIDGPSGRRRIDMILDTGATYTSISWSVALDIGYDPATSPSKVSTIAASGIIELPLITVDRMEVEGLEAENFDFLRFYQGFHAAMLSSRFDHLYFEHLNLFRISNFEFRSGFPAL